MVKRPPEDLELTGAQFGDRAFLDLFAPIPERRHKTAKGALLTLFSCFGTEKRTGIHRGRPRHRPKHSRRHPGSARSFSDDVFRAPIAEVIGQGERRLAGARATMSKSSNGGDARHVPCAQAPGPVHGIAEGAWPNTVEKERQRRQRLR